MVGLDIDLFHKTIFLLGSSHLLFSDENIFAHQYQAQTSNTLLTTTSMSTTHQYSAVSLSPQPSSPGHVNTASSPHTFEIVKWVFGVGFPSALLFILMCLKLFKYLKNLSQQSSREQSRNNEDIEMQQCAQYSPQQSDTISLD